VQGARIESAGAARTAVVTAFPGLGRRGLPVDSQFPVPDLNVYLVLGYPWQLYMNHHEFTLEAIMIMDGTVPGRSDLGPHDPGRR